MISKHFFIFFLGINVCYSSKNNVLIKFTSTCNGLYRCTYCLEICVNENKMEPESYDLPPFIPVNKILSKKSFNVGDICSVTKTIAEYLYAYTVRDKDIHDVQVETFFCWVFFFFLLFFFFDGRR